MSSTPNTSGSFDDSNKPLEISSVITSNDEEPHTSSDAAADNNEHPSPPVPSPYPLWKYFRNWIIFYFIFWTLLIICTSSAMDGVIILETFAKIVLSFCAFSAVGYIRKKKFRSSFAQLFGLGIALVIVYKSDALYPGCYHWFKPCQEVETVLHQLQYESSLTSLKLPYKKLHSPMQALGLGNGYMGKLGDALVIHFDRYSRNETGRFPYVESLNLLANSFNDEGAKVIIDALGHPFAYTDSLLLGRNNNIGDSTAQRIATLIQSQYVHAAVVVKGAAPKDDDEKDVSSSHNPYGEKLDFLNFEDTSVTKEGITALYKAIGVTTTTNQSSFDHLNFQKTDPAISPNPFFSFWKSKPVVESLDQIHEATGLQSLNLGYNGIANHDVPSLVKNVLQTNITSLNLIFNNIGPKGVSSLIPLTKQLTELQLGFNWRIGDEGAIILANALKDSNTTIETLSIWRCRIGQRGAEAFLSIFPNNTKLKFLSMTTNSGSDGKKNSNNIKTETLEKIQKATAANWI